MLWLNLSSQELQQRIFSFTSEDGTSEIFQLNCYGGSTRLRYISNSCGKKICDIILPAELALDLNRWYHVAVTVNVTQAILYVDGVQLGSSDLG